MIYAKFDVDLIDHPKLLEVGAIARDLCAWSVMYCRKHQTDGAIPSINVATTPWGAGGRSNLKAAAKLVEAGLWLQTDSGFALVNYAAKNDTRAAIEDRRKAERARKAKWRAERCPVDVPSSVPPGHPPDETRVSRVRPGSGSGSGSGSDLLSPEKPEREIQVESPRAPADVPSEPGDAAAPAWWAKAIATVEMNTPFVAENPGALWLAYSGSRDRKGWATNQRDASAWLAQVLERQQRDRRERSGSLGPPRKPLSSPPTPPALADGVPCTPEEFADLEAKLATFGQPVISPPSATEAALVAGGDAEAHAKTWEARRAANIAALRSADADSQRSAGVSNAFRAPDGSSAQATTKTRPGATQSEMAGTPIPAKEASL